MMPEALAFLGFGFAWGLIHSGLMVWLTLWVESKLPLPPKDPPVD